MLIYKCKPVKFHKWKDYIDIWKLYDQIPQTFRTALVWLQNSFSGVYCFQHVRDS